MFDLRTLRIRKSLQVEDDGSQCVSLSFSHDSNLLLTQGGAPEWNLTLWNWAKARQFAKIRTSDTLPIYQVWKHVVNRGQHDLSIFAWHSYAPAYLRLHQQQYRSRVESKHLTRAYFTRYPWKRNTKQVGFSPVDTSLACVCGNSVFQFYRVTEGDLRPMTAPRVKEHNFLSHTWLKQPEDHLILGTETGQLLMFRSGDFVCYLVGAPGGQTKITALLSYSQVCMYVGGTLTS